MKIIGLIGGTGWVSTHEYYKLINLEVNKRLGGLEAAKCILYSLNYGDVNRFYELNQPENVFGLLKNAASKLENAGAEFLALCANTTHQFADRLTKYTTLPIIHIAEATAKVIKGNNISKVGLLGTKQTMEKDFYTSKLRASGIKTLAPTEEERNFVNHTIFNELLKNNFLPESKNKFLQIIYNLKKQGAEGIILGCTEIPLLVNHTDVDIPLFDTLKIHVNAIINYSIQE